MEQEMKFLMVLENLQKATLIDRAEIELLKAVAKRQEAIISATFSSLLIAAPHAKQTIYQHLTSLADAAALSDPATAEHLQAAAAFLLATHPASR